METVAKSIKILLDLRSHILNLLVIGCADNLTRVMPES